MVTSLNIKEIYNKITSDENCCRLLYYGENALGRVENVRDLKNFNSVMKEIIRVSPQIETMLNVDEIRLFVLKSFSKIEFQQDILRREQIEIGILVPIRLQENDFRVYSLEDKLVELLDGFQITGIGLLDYSEGHFLKSPVDNYCYYKMTFTTKQSRGERIYARY